LLSEQQLGEHLAQFEHEAFRFEIRDRYNSDVGRTAFRKFLAGEVDDYSWHRPWLDRIRRDTANGRIWRRVRIVSVPLSDWTRYGIEVARLNVEAGEDIRYLSRDAAARLHVQPLDAWLLDDELLLHLRFDDSDDRFVDAELITDDEVVAAHRAWRDLVWRHAVRLDRFAPAPS
jgi:hypothetical protein